jgi:hypothetical protein
LAQGLEAGGETGAVVALARGQVMVELLGRHPGGEQRITLQVEDLAAVGFGNAQVAELHRLSLKRAVG